MFIRHGRNHASSSREPIPRRNAVTPCGPTTGNRVLASDAPPCSESMAINSSSTAISGDAVFGNTGSAGASWYWVSAMLLSIDESPVAEFLSNLVILCALNVIPVRGILVLQMKCKNNVCAMTQCRVKSRTEKSIKKIFLGSVFAKKGGFKVKKCSKI